jgi:hypothetical protein
LAANTGFSLASAARVGIGARAFVAIDAALLQLDFTGGQIRHALDDLDRGRLVVELARLLAGDGPLVRFQRELVLHLARHLPLAGDLLGGEAHAVGHADIFVGEHVHVDRGMEAAHRHHGHRFGTAGDHHIGLADADAVGGHRHGGDARGAEAIDGDAAHGIGQAGQQHGVARHVEAGFAFGEGAADDGVLDQFRIEARHLGHGGADRGDQQVVGTDVAEHAARRLADRGAGGGNDVGVLKLFAHFGSPQLRTGLPVCIMPMIRSWVLGWFSSSMKALRSRSSSHCSLTRLP